MIRKARKLILFMNILMLFVLIEIRQESQLAFGQLQKISSDQRIEKQILNQVKLDYLKALNVVPIVAKEKGFVAREVRDGI